MQRLHDYGLRGLVRRDPPEPVFQPRIAEETYAERRRAAYERHLAAQPRPKLLQAMIRRDDAKAFRAFIRDLLEGHPRAARMVADDPVGAEVVERLLRRAARC